MFVYGYLRTIIISFCCYLTCFTSTTLADTRPVSFKQDVDDSIPFSIAISGGISLGSYEAGLNWALIKYLKSRRNELKKDEPDNLYPELMSSAGASAGSINALLSAISWCIDDDKINNSSPDHFNEKSTEFSDSINENLFRTLWLNVGIDEMLPMDHGKYRDGDAVLTRSAFDNAIQKITKILKADIFRADCSIPLGITVTRVAPVKMSIAGVEVENQRFLIPVRIQSVSDNKHSGRIEIVSQLMNKNNPSLGNVMYLRQTKKTGTHQYIIEPEHLINAVLTSSAYPLAFGKVRLPHCADLASNDKEATPDVCPAGYQPRVDDFIDGGVFDNVPLGLAKALAEPTEWDLASRERWKQSARPFSYIYLDPDNRRAVQKSTNNKENKDKQTQDSNTDFMASGIRSHFRFLGGAITTGRNYELYNVLRGGDWTSHSYDYACQLIVALKINKKTSAQCTTNLNPTIGKCQQLFKNKLDKQQRLSRNESDTIAACLLQDVQKLQLIYYDRNSGKKSSAEITRFRRQLLKRMSILARQNGLHQLALAIEGLKEDKLGDRRILLTRRFAPITGDMLSAFGAFVDRPFREYDYFAGIYDAVYGLADFFCKQRTAYETCLAHETRRIYYKLKIPSVKDANTIFQLLATHEHPDYGQQSSPWQWLVHTRNFTNIREKENLTIIFTALSQNFDPAQDNIYEKPAFTDFIRVLFKNGYDVSHSSQFMKRIYRLKDKDSKTWYYPLTSRISSRVLAIEQQSDDKYAPAMRSVLGLGSFALHSYIKDEESKLLIRSAAPAGTWINWLPYEVGADFRNGGLIVSWLPGINLTDNLSLDFKITPIHLNRYAGNDIWFSQMDLFVSYRREGVISSFGAGPTYTYTWKEWPDARRNNVGASIYVAILGDKMRFTLGERSDSDNGFPGDSTYLYISLMDLPGFVYWLTKGR